jgi:hypothetical protein
MQVSPTFPRLQDRLSAAAVTRCATWLPEAVIQCCVSRATKAALRAAAEPQQITESALLKRMLQIMLHSADLAEPGNAADRAARQARLYVWLTPVPEAELRFSASNQRTGCHRSNPQPDRPGGTRRRGGHALPLASHFRRIFEHHFVVPRPALGGRAMGKGPAFPLHYRRASTHAHDRGVVDRPVRPSSCLDGRHGDS